MRLARWLLMVVYFVALSVTGGGIGWYGSRYYRAKTTGCKPCQDAAASSPTTVATEPGMGVSNP